MANNVILIVEEDDETRDRLATWLGGPGRWVLTCAGPLGPVYSCPGGTGEPCPLGELADVVVLDMWLESDTLMEGPPGWELLDYYVAAGKKVVALAADGDPMTPEPSANVIVLRRPAEREALVDAVSRLTSDRLVDAASGR